MDIMKTLLENIDGEGLSALHARLKRGRRKFYEFGFNGRSVLTRRKDAIEAVVTELTRRNGK